MSTGHLAFVVHAADFIDPRLMPPTFESGVQEGFDDLFDTLQAPLRPQAEDVGIIVLSGALRHERVAAEGGPYALDLIGGNAHTDPCPAD